LHNTPALHYSSTPFKNHATAEPSLSDLALRTRFYKPNKKWQRRYIKRSREVIPLRRIPNGFER